ncbi:MAG: hypothetical protein D6746_05125 [Bacteroidetes bacterium]|nr:MAG: hypothetical protein D6746_05125 [Bacteroidota bacterium]
MINVLPVHQALVRRIGKKRGGMWMAVAASFTAMSPAHRFDEDAFAAWCGVDTKVAAQLKRMMRDEGWLDNDSRLAGFAAEVLIGAGHDDEADKLFVKLCSEISNMRGVRYQPTPSRRVLFMERAKEHGSKTVYDVCIWKAKAFMKTILKDGRSMAKYARIETLCNKTNFDKYFDQYLDGHE